MDNVILPQLTGACKFMVNLEKKKLVNYNTKLKRLGKESHFISGNVYIRPVRMHEIHLFSD